MRIPRCKETRRKSEWAQMQRVMWHIIQTNVDLSSMPSCLFYCSWRCLAERKPLQNMTSSVFRKRQHWYNYTIPNYLGKKDPSNHMQHHCNYLMRCFMVISSIHPAWQRPGMPGLAGIMFNFRRTAGREDSRVDKEREVLKKSQPKNEDNEATVAGRGFRPWELLFLFPIWKNVVL